MGECLFKKEKIINTSLISSNPISPLVVGQQKVQQIRVIGHTFAIFLEDGQQPALNAQALYCTGCYFESISTVTLSHNNPLTHSL